MLLTRTTGRLLKRESRLHHKVALQQQMELMPAVLPEQRPIREALQRPIPELILSEVQHPGQEPTTPVQIPMEQELDPIQVLADQILLVRELEQEQELVQQQEVEQVLPPVAERELRQEAEQELRASQNFFLKEAHSSWMGFFAFIKVGLFANSIEPAFISNGVKSSVIALGNVTKTLIFSF